MNHLHRIMDANTNRACEGLRVMEDIARFVLDDESLSRSLKELRHQLRSQAVEIGISQSQLLESRDTTNDVGTNISTDQEATRANGYKDLISAAAKRAQEAIRVLEECSKTPQSPASSANTPYESIRYRLYDIEAKLMLSLPIQNAQWKLCVLLTRSLCLHHEPEAVIEMIASGGGECIQIREKGLKDDDLFEQCSKLTKVAHTHGLQVIINDRADIALACGADGVHLGNDDLPIHAARKILGNDRIIGKTCPTIDQVHQAFADGADYCGVGPVFESSTKPKPNLSGLQLLKQIMESSELASKPMLAISGINASNIDQIARTGFPGVAVSSAICSAQDPKLECQRLLRAMEQGVEICDEMCTE